MLTSKIIACGDLNALVSILISRSGNLGSLFRLQAILRCPVKQFPQTRLDSLSRIPHNKIIASTKHIFNLTTHKTDNKRQEGVCKLVLKPQITSLGLLECDTLQELQGAKMG